jgi:ectoine hydroxylase-related dioxygenase (phytanoyl-CoA dioxygenase family)
MVEQLRNFFHEQGYLLIPNLFSRQEIDAVLADEQQLHTHHLVTEANGRNKGGMVVEDGATPRLQFGIHKTDSLFALLCRHPRLAGLTQSVMGIPLYIYHSKLAFKAPFTGSVQYWHQDYSYWQKGHAQPTMASCLVMLDEHTEDNACMQVLAGSHRAGLVDHEYAPRESTGDNQLRIPSSALPDYCRRYPRIKLVGQPGTVALWHSNTMHASSHNISENPRRALIVAFNAVGNSREEVVKDSPFTAHSNKAVVLSADDSLLSRQPERTAP